MKLKRASTKSKNVFAITFILIIVIFVIVVVYVTYINTIKKDIYTKKIYEQQKYDSMSIMYKRGNIVDRKGTILASSKRVYNVILDCNVLLTASKNNEEINILENTTNMLRDIFEIDEKKVREQIDKNPTSSYYILKEAASVAQADNFNNYLEKNSNKVSGIWLEESYKRYYPYGPLACAVLGFSNSNNEGTLGIEQFYNETLNGTYGRKYGHIKSYENIERIIKEPENGKDVVITLDANIQSIVEKHLIEFNNAHYNDAKEGRGSLNSAVIVMNPNNGEILAMASYPNFDLNDPFNLSAYYSEEKINSMSQDEEVSALSDLWRNYAISYSYEPGSTSKAITMSAGLEEGVLKGDELYNCTGGLNVDDHYIKCHITKGHGMVDLTRAISDSCNVAMMDIGLNLGAERLSKYLSVFNFGKYTNIDLPSEEKGLLYEWDKMIDSDIATNSFGQNYTCTMIQMACAYCSIINGGTYYRPYIVKQIKNSDGEVLINNTPTILNKTISTDTSNKLKRYMEETVTSGTAMLLQLNDYNIGAKTGTAEKLPRGENNYVTSVACFSPTDVPEVLVYTVLDEPNVDRQSTTDYVNRLTKDIIEEIFPYLNIKTINE